MSIYGYFAWFVIALCAGGFALAAAELVSDLRKRVKP